MDLLSAAVTLTLVLDPFGNIPAFLAALAHVDAERRRRVIIREMLIALVFLLVFLFGGRVLLEALGVEQSALGIAGGVVLFLVSISMIFPGRLPLHEGAGSEPLIVPLAVPLTAGPSAMATVMLLASGAPERMLEWLAAVLIAWGFSAVILTLSADLRRLLGERTLIAIERLMGLVLTAVAVQMLLSGLREAFRGGL